MRFTDLLRLVFENLRRMVARVIFTSLGVTIGTGAIVILISLGAGLQASFNDQLENFGAINQITVFQIDENIILNRQTITEISAIEGVETVTPLVNIGGQIQLNRYQGGINLNAIEPAATDDFGLTVAQGTDRLGNMTVVAGGRVAEQLIDPSRPEAAPPDLFGQTLILTIDRFDEDSGQIQTRRWRLRVGGVLEATGAQQDFNIYLSLDDAEDIQTWQQGGQNPRWEREGYQQLVVITELDPAVVQEVEQELSEGGYAAFSIGSALQGLNTFFIIIQAVLGGIGSIALVVAAIGIGNTMVMAVLERTREIGLMKAVGAHNRDVISIFVLEAGVIGLIGGVFGAGAGWVIARIIDAVARVYIQAQAGGEEVFARIAYTPPWLIAFAIGFSMFIGLVAGIFPAFRAVQLDPVAALRYE